jgi:hypothetical protein
MSIIFWLALAAFVGGMLGYAVGYHDGKRGRL